MGTVVKFYSGWGKEPEPEKEKEQDPRPPFKNGFRDYVEMIRPGVIVSPGPRAGFVLLGAATRTVEEAINTKGGIDVSYFDQKMKILFSHESRKPRTLFRKAIKFDNKVEGDIWLACFTDPYREIWKRFLREEVEGEFPLQDPPLLEEIENPLPAWIDSTRTLLEAKVLELKPRMLERLEALPCEEENTASPYDYPLVTAIGIFSAYIMRFWIKDKRPAHVPPSLGLLK
jgi:hypothetical protein